MLEAIIAGVIMVSFLAFVSSSNFSAPEDASLIAYKALEGLNKQGLLKQAAQSGDFSLINNNVQVFGYSHSVQICFSSSCLGTQPTGSNVWVASYFTPGSSIYEPREVKLYLYR